MASEIEDEAEKRGISKAKYVRGLLRQAHSSPFDTEHEEVDLVTNDDDAAEAQTGAA